MLIGELYDNKEKGDLQALIINVKEANILLDSVELYVKNNPRKRNAKKLLIQLNNQLGIKQF